MKMQKDRTLKDELPRLISAQYATGDQWRKKIQKEWRDEAKAKTTPNCGQLIKNRNLFLTHLEAGKSKIKGLVMYHESLLPRLF